jgi:hypothetical protein
VGADRSRTRLASAPRSPGRRRPGRRSRPSQTRSTLQVIHHVRCSKTPGRCDLLGCVQRRHLPRQVVIPRPRCELVEAHRHAHPKGYKPPGRSGRPELLPAVGLYVANRRGYVVSRSASAGVRLGGTLLEGGCGRSPQRRAGCGGWKLCHAACRQAVRRASFATAAPTPLLVGAVSCCSWGEA